MSPELICSLLSALEYVIRGDDRAKRARLALILLAWWLYYLVILSAFVFFGLDLASWLR